MTPGATERQKFSPLKVVPGSALQRRPPRPLEHATSTHKLGPVRPRYDEGINQLSRQSIVRACKLHFTSLRADRYGACLLAGRAGESPARAPQPTRLPRGRGRLCLFSCRSARERGWGGGRRARRGARLEVPNAPARTGGGVVRRGPAPGGALGPALGPLRRHVESRQHRVRSPAPQARGSNPESRARLPKASRAQARAGGRGAARTPARRAPPAAAQAARARSHSPGVRRRGAVPGQGVGARRERSSM